MQQQQQHTSTSSTGIGTLHQSNTRHHSRATPHTSTATHSFHQSRRVFLVVAICWPLAVSCAVVAVSRSVSCAMSTLDPKQSNAVFKRLRQHVDNKTCADCESRSPTWASVPFGVFICLQCAAIHRRLGVHISFVRSTVLDRWTVDQLLQMVVGGNASCSAYFKSKGWTDSVTDNHQAKYTSKAATQYKQHLERDVARQRDQLLDTLFHSPDMKAAAGPQLDGLDALAEDIRSKSPPIVSAAAAATSNSPSKLTSHSSLPSPSSSSTPLTASSATSSASSTSPATESASSSSSPSTRQVIRKEQPTAHSSVAGPLSASTRAAATASGSGHSTSAVSTIAASSPSSSSSPAPVASSDEWSAGVAAGGTASHTASLLTTSTRRPVVNRSGVGSSSAVRAALTTKKKSGLAVQQTGADEDMDDLFEQAQREANASRQASSAMSADASVTGSSIGDRDDVQSVGSASRSSFVSSPSHSNSSDSDSAKLKRYANATSISSAHYFQSDDEGDSDSKARLSQFSSANAIGSDAFFGREQDGDNGGGGGASGEAVDMAAIRDAAATKARQIASYAGSILKQVRDRY